MFPKSPQKRNPPPGSPYGAPTYRKMLHLQSPLYIFFKVPRKETTLPGSPYRAPTYRTMLTAPKHILLHTYTHTYIDKQHEKYSRNQTESDWMSPSSGEDKAILHY
jgi:hypothetical protein